MSPTSRRRSYLGLLRVGRLLAAVVLSLAGLPNVSTTVGGAEPKQKHAKLDRVLTRAAASGDRAPRRVIVRTRPGRESVVAERIARHGDRIEQEHRRFDALTTTVHGEDLSALDADPDVRSVSIDAVVTGGDVGADTDTNAGGENLLLSSLGLEETEHSGEKIGIAVIDSGLELNDDLSGGRGDKFIDFTAGGKRGHAYDDYGHGTHVATLIAGNGKKSERDVAELRDGKWQHRKRSAYRGVAPKSRIISLKVLDANGAGYTSSVLQAIEYAIENRDNLKIDVINLSLGHPIYESPETDPLVRAVEEAVRAGIVVVVAAGNFGLNQDSGIVGYAGITSPGNAPSAITIGAGDLHGTSNRSDDSVAPYSSRGPAWYSGLAKPDLVAPGHRLVAVGAEEGTLYRRYPERQVFGRPGDKTARYLRLSGTSMAAAVTSGVVALMLDASRDLYDAQLTPNAVKAILEYTAIPLAQVNPLAQGTGSLNGAGAVALAQKVDPGRPIGQWWLTGGVQPETVIAGQALAWSRSVIWNNRLVSGDVVFVNRAAWSQSSGWGDTVVWGTGDNGDTVVWGTAGDTVVWGTTDLVWGDPSVWSHTVVWGTGLLGTTDGSGVLGPTTVVWGTVQVPQ